MEHTCTVGPKLWASKPASSCIANGGVDARWSLHPLIPFVAIVLIEVALVLLVKSRVDSVERRAFRSLTTFDVATLAMERAGGLKCAAVRAKRAFSKGRISRQATVHPRSERRASAVRRLSNALSEAKQMTNTLSDAVLNIGQQATQTVELNAVTLSHGGTHGTQHQVPTSGESPCEQSVVYASLLGVALDLVRSELAAGASLDTVMEELVTTSKYLVPVTNEERAATAGAQSRRVLLSGTGARTGHSSPLRGVLIALLTVL
jgi:hypothetical protein